MLGILFFVTKHGFTLVDILLVKIVEYGVLKTHMHCMKSSDFVKIGFEYLLSRK